MGELGASMADPPYTIFYKEKVILVPHLYFLPKVSSEHNISQEIHLPVFYLKPHVSREESSLHALDVRRAHAFYLNRIKPFGASP